MYLYVITIRQTVQVNVPESSSILIYIQQDAMLHSLFYLETALHVSGGTTTHHQERKQLYLQHLVFVTPLLLSAAIVEDLELVRVYPKHVQQFPDKINCVTLHLVGYILEYYYDAQTYEHLKKKYLDL